ncbi:MAG: GNAT family N-acetyltransferase [Peptococcaceae bacterium]
MVRPQMSGRGIGSALIKYAVEFARNDGCKALRLDTGGQNIPAVALYEKMNLILSCVPLKRLAMLLLMKIICF